MTLEIDNLTLGYQRHPAVHHLNLAIEAGAMMAIVGPNGAGKSTLLKGIVGQLKPLAGAIRFKGISTEDIAYLPQQNSIDRHFPITVWEMAAMGLWRRVGAFGALDGDGRAMVDEALAQVGLVGFERRLIGTLSGGQMQRLLFARLRLQDARLLLFDEPFNAIDEATCELLLALIDQWHHQGRTILAVWHDLEKVARYFPETLLMARRLVAVGPTVEVLQPKNLAEANMLRAAFDDKARPCNGLGRCADA